MIDIRVVEGQLTAFAPALEQLAMHVERTRSSLLVQIVDVLRAEKETRAQSALQGCQHSMPWVGLGGRCDRPAHGIEVPHELRISLPCIWRGDLFDTVIPP